MADVESARALLAMALQDLLDGEKALVERLPAVAEAARDDKLQALIRADLGRSESQRDRLSAMLEALRETEGDAPNIWLRAILDDADNDAETIAAGPLRDTALTGALRKAKQSESVSYETALALAERLKLAEPAEGLSRSRDEEAAADEALAKILARLAAAAQ